MGRGQTVDGPLEGNEPGRLILSVSCRRRTPDVLAEKVAALFEEKAVLAHFEKKFLANNWGYCTTRSFSCKWNINLFDRVLKSLGEVFANGEENWLLPVAV